MGEIGLLKRYLAPLLLELSYVEGEVTLSSGKKSDYYFDCRQTALHPRGAFLMGRLLLQMVLPYEVQGVGGMEFGAVPIISALSVASYIYPDDSPLPGFVVRKKTKAHGIGNRIEGLANFSQGAKVAILDDVVTSGKTLLDACEVARDNGFEVATVLCILDREEGGGEALAAAGYTLDAAFTRVEILAINKNVG